MLKDKFENLLAFLKDKKILITTHDLADVDGLVSCYGLNFFLNQYFKHKEIFLYFSEISKSAKNFMKNFNVKFPSYDFFYNDDIDDSNIDLVVILDTNNMNQVKFPNNFEILNKEIPIVFIDHHYVNSNNNSYKNFNSLIFQEYASTAEIICELYKEFNVELPLPYKVLFISGILTDSGFFKYGTNDTITYVSKLLDPEFNFQEILAMLEVEESISEKIAKIKGIQRVKLIRERDWLMGITYVGSYEADVASALIKIGFDVGIVWSRKTSEYRISTRASNKICLRTGLHLGKILEELSGEYEGSGGGHDGAASLKGKIGLDNILKKIEEKILTILKKQEF